jgi:Leucine-rich repeat (LRR) protein
MQILEDDPEPLQFYILIDQTLKDAPDSTFIDLSDQNIDDDALEQIAPSIALLSNLEELNLSGNLFTQLPVDLSGWQNVQNLNLSNI